MFLGKVSSSSISASSLLIYQCIITYYTTFVYDIFPVGEVMGSFASVQIFFGGGNIRGIAICLFGKGWRPEI